MLNVGYGVVALEIEKWGKLLEQFHRKAGGTCQLIECGSGEIGSAKYFLFCFSFKSMLIKTGKLHKQDSFRRSLEILLLEFWIGS
jgi:nitrogenase molybdenum-iron protein alpha/beta subunit